MPAISVVTCTAKINCFELKMPMGKKLLGKLKRNKVEEPQVEPEEDLGDAMSTQEKDDVKVGKKRAPKNNMGGKKRLRSKLGNVGKHQKRVRSKENTPERKLEKLEKLELQLTLKRSREEQKRAKKDKKLERKALKIQKKLEALRSIKEKPHQGSEAQGPKVPRARKIRVPAPRPPRLPYLALVANLHKAPKALRDMRAAASRR